MNANQKLRVEMTSTAFRGKTGLKNLEKCREAAENYGWEFGVQLHNSSEPGEIETLAAAGVPLSAHGPLNSPFNWNLAAESAEPTFEGIEANVKLFRKLKIKSCVFHGFYMTDRPVPAFGGGRSYDECMKTVFRPELAMGPRERLNGRYTLGAEFRRRRLRVRERLAELRRKYRSFLFCIENDFPAYGASNMLAVDAALLDHPLCLDTGHLWMTARLFELDFQLEAAAFLKTGRVRMVHLHASKYTREGYPLEEWGDGHLPLDTPGEMDLPRFVGACREAGVDYYVLEVVRGVRPISGF